MRLRLSIKRHELPPVQILHGVSNPETATISELIAQINNVIPLESDDGTWGLEDYIVSVAGFECVHYTLVLDVLKDDDEVEIRAAQTIDARTRRVSGRTQISREGARLLDGLPYGSRRVRRTPRPPIRIPPLKRRRLLNNDDDDADAEIVSPDEYPASHASKSHTAESTSSSEDSDFDGNPATSDDASSDSHGNTSEEDAIHDDELNGLASEGRIIASQSPSPPSVKKRKRGQVNDVEYARSDSLSSSDPGSDVSDSALGTSSEASDSSDESSDEEDSLDSDTSSDISSSSSESSSSDSDDLTRTDGVPDKKARPSNNEALLKGLVHPSLLKQSQTSTITSPPGEGKARTHARNQRRKETRRRRWLSQQMSALSGDGNDDHTSQAGALEHGVDVGVIQSRSEIGTPNQADMSRRRDLRGESEVDVGHEKSQTEVLRDQLLQKYAEKSSGDGNVPGSQHQPFEQNVRAVEASGNESVRDEETRPLAAAERERQLESKAASVATTGRRLRIGEAGRRMIRSSIAPYLPRKEETKVVEPKATTKRRWQDVLKMSVVECGPTAQDFEFEPPPYPFEQHWHGLPHGLMKKRRADYLKPIHEKYGVSDAAGQKRKRETDEFVPLNSRYVQESDNDDPPDQRSSRPNVTPSKTGSGGGLNYDDEDTNEDASGDSHTLKGPSTTSSGSVDDDQKDADEGYPVSPDHLTGLPPLTRDQCKPGTYIYFKRLEISASSGSPEISDFRTARIEGVESKTLELKLARRDVSHQDEKARTRHNKFNVDADGEGEADEDEGRYLTAEVDELIQPMVIKA